MKALWAFVVAVLCVSTQAAEITKEELKSALEKNPDVLLDVLRGKKKELFEIVSSAAQEEQARRQREEEEAERKAFEESFKNPLKPSIDSATRVRGNKKAKYTLVEYSDFQCPYCARGFQTVEALRKKYGDSLRFVYKNLPLAMHPQAMPAARYLEAIGLQSQEKAWAFHDKLFSNQGQISPSFLEETAKSLGVDIKKLQEDLNSKKVQDRLDADMAEAGKFGFSGTPAFLINGIPVRGAYPVEYFESIIQRLDKK